MRVMRPQFILCGLLVSASIVSAFGADTPQEGSKSAARAGASLFEDKVLARGKGFEIRQSQIDDMFIAYKANRASIGQRVPEAARAKIESDILEKLIATELFLQRATEQDRVKAKEISDHFIAEQKKLAPTEESFKRQLIASGMSPQEFEKQISEQAIVKAVIDREIKDAKVITQADIQKFYDENAKAYQEPELVRVSHILFSIYDRDTEQELSKEKKEDKKRTAERILERARKGEDFASLVRQFSEDKPSKDKGGEYTIARAKDDPRRGVVPEFESAAFSMSVNQISDIVTTRYGYHIIKLLEKIPPKPIELAKVEARIKEILLQNAVQKELPLHIEKLKKEAGVEVLQKPGSSSN